MFVSREAAILHADVDAFFVSVEQRDDPSLRGRPVVVGGGVVMAASYEARAFGIHGGMGGWQAKRLCPHLVVVYPRGTAYVDASKAVFAIFHDTSPVVEGMGLEEAFLDVRGMERIAGTPEEIARRLRRRVREEVGLPLSVGVASTKVLAKIASRSAKPDGVHVVPAGGELEFLHPLPVERLWGVGPATTERLHSLGFTTVGQLAAAAEADLVSMLGRAIGRQLHAIANNRDPRRVRAGRRRRSLGSQRALGRKARSPAELDAVLLALVDRVTGRMRSAGFAGRTVVLRVRHRDFSRISRSRTLARPTAATATILAAARALLAATLPDIERRGVTLLGLTLYNLDDGRGDQLALPVDESDRNALDAAIDDVRELFGTRAVTRAAALALNDRPEAPNPWEVGPARES
jgi:DNA polymerase IV